MMVLVLKWFGREISQFNEGIQQSLNSRMQTFSERLT